MYLYNTATQKRWFVESVITKRNRSNNTFHILHFIEYSNYIGAHAKSPVPLPKR